MKIIYIKKSTIKLILIITIILAFDIVFLKVKSDTLKYSDYDLALVEKYNNKKLLALTFDDGPSKYTLQILDILQKENVKATFFVLGQNIINNEDIVLREYTDGHLIGIHSYEHVFFTKLKKEDILYQITTTNSMINDITNFSPIYIRVPYGSTNNRVNSILKEQNLENILWNVDSLDWSYKDSDKATTQVFKNVTGNDIILMHDTFDSTVKATENIIKHYKENGYEFVTIYEFYRIKKIAKSLN